MILIDVSGGVVQQVLSDDEDVKVVLFDEDNLKEQGLGEYLREKLLDTLVKKHNLKAVDVDLPDADEAGREVGGMKRYHVYFYDKSSSETRTLTVSASSEDDAETRACDEADRLGWARSFRPDSAKLVDPEDEVADAL